VSRLWWTVPGVMATMVVMEERVRGPTNGLLIMAVYLQRPLTMEADISCR